MLLRVTSEEESRPDNIRVTSEQEPSPDNIRVTSEEEPCLEAQVLSDITKQVLITNR